MPKKLSRAQVEALIERGKRRPNAQVQLVWMEVEALYEAKGLGYAVAALDTLEQAARLARKLLTP